MYVVYFRGESRAPYANSLWHRIREHTRSISRAALPASEFAVRLLRLPDVHADLRESGLRVFHQPAWNAACGGLATTSRDRPPSKATNKVHPGRNGMSHANTYDSRTLERATSTSSNRGLGTRRLLGPNDVPGRSQPRQSSRSCDVASVPPGKWQNFMWYLKYGARLLAGPYVLPVWLRGIR